MRVDLRGEMNWQRLKAPVLIIAGPLGCYVAYLVLFVGRFVNPTDYPLLFERYGAAGISAEVLAALLCLVASSIFLLKAGPIDEFKPSRPPLPTHILVAIIAAVVALMMLNIYAVLGTLSPSVFLEKYARYQMHATNGNAWMILACYAALYLLLVDMFFGGVRRMNGAFFLAAVTVVSISGGRSILALFALAFLIMLMCQRVRLRDLLLTSTATAVILGASFLAVTDMRDTRTPEVAQEQARLGKLGELAPTEIYEELNYNAAFITEDVLRGLGDGSVTPSSHALDDAKWRFVPRGWDSSKPQSSSETIALYPEVAERGTNITLPLKANLMMHFGGGAFYLDWLVVLAAQIAFIAGIAARSRVPTFIAFCGFFFGCAFTLVARGGILNARLLDQVMCLLAAYAAYRCALLMTGWVKRRMASAITA